MPRNRSRTKWLGGGRWTRQSTALNPDFQEGTNSVYLTETVSDEVHEPPFTAEGPLSVFSYEGEFPRIRYRTSYSYNHKTGTNLPLIPNGITPLLGLRTNEWLAQAKSTIQQNSPIVDLPANVLEALTELPLSVKSVVDFLSGLGEGQLERAHLANEWLVQPLVTDVMKLVDLSNQIASNVRSLHKRARTGRAEGKLSGDAYISRYGDIQGTRIIPYGTTQHCLYFRFIASSDQWFSARLTPNFDPNDLGFLTRGVASRALGLSSETLLGSIWEAIPFSWLIDYFSNLGDIVGQLGNTPFFTVNSINLMCHARMGVLMTPIPINIVEWEGTPKTHYRVYKTRSVHLAPLSWVTFGPLLSLGQATNLVALATSIARNLGRAKR